MSCPGNPGMSVSDPPTSDREEMCSGRKRLTMDKFVDSFDKIVKYDACDQI